MALFALTRTVAASARKSFGAVKAQMPTKSSKLALEMIAEAFKNCYVVLQDERDDEVAVSPCMRLSMKTLPARTARQGDQ
jgi:hypothetical protein